MSVAEFSRRKMIGGMSSPGSSWEARQPFVQSACTMNNIIIHQQTHYRSSVTGVKVTFDNAHKNVTVNFWFCGPSTIGTWLETLSAWNHIASLQKVVPNPNGATMTQRIGILKGINNSTYVEAATNVTKLKLMLIQKENENEKSHFHPFCK